MIEFFSQLGFGECVALGVVFGLLAVLAVGPDDDGEFDDVTDF